MRSVGPLTIILDILEAFLLAFVLIIISPLKSLKSLSQFNRTVQAVRLLGVNGVLASTMRATIDIRTGRVDRAISILESVLAVMEESHFEEPQPISEHALEWLFSWVAKLYLRTAQIDDAALTVIRANKSIGVTKLNDVNDMDVKTAHIVKAGLAAGKLLDENGSATFMVQAGELEQRRKRLRPKKAEVQDPKLGKIIPFPVKP
ncbi:hypothetical protein N9D31_02260 [Oligoflexaceae bacterium]|nr:hypothetical protein [Oligoflexaceae bacterium]